MDELNTITQEITKKVREECQEMMNVQLRGIYDQLKHMGFTLPIDNFGQGENGTPPELVKSSCNSVDQPQNFLNIKVPTLCRLCVKHPDKGRVIVGRGQVFPLSREGDNFIHGIPITPNNVKVCVDEVLIEFQLTPLPVPCDEHETVGNAAGNFVQWPKDLVILGQEPEKKKGPKAPSRKLKKIASKESASPILKNQASHNDARLSERCRTLRFLIDNMPPESTTKAADKNVEVFKFHENVKDPIYITSEDVYEFLRLSWLNIPILQIFMMYTHKLCTDFKDNSFAFMCPSVLALARESKHQDATSRYICEVMKDAKEKRFILAPYIQSKHWMLLMYCVEESAVYLFDPLKQKRQIHVKTPWETAYKVATKYGCKKNNQNNLVWYDEVQCPQQNGGTECGYFVMKYMNEIIMLSRKDPKTKWKEVLGKGYTNEQIGEIRDIWADFFIREYM